MRTLGNRAPETPPRRFGILGRAFACLALWHRRNRERRQLSQMSELQRRDIGITYLDVWCEVNKPFWRR